MQLIAGCNLTKLTANISTEFWGGTDSSVYLKLRNPETLEECETLVLDKPKNTWCYCWPQEIFTSSEHAEMFAPCKDFFSSNVLEFNFKIDGRDKLKLTGVRLEFGVTSYTWRGAHWFNNLEHDNWHPTNISIDLSTPIADNQPGCTLLN